MPKFKQKIVTSRNVDEVKKDFSIPIASFRTPAPNFASQKHYDLLSQLHGGWKVGHWKDFIREGETVETPSAFSVFEISEGTVLCRGITFDKEHIYTLDFFDLPNAEEMQLDRIHEVPAILNLCAKAMDYHNFMIETVPRLILCKSLLDEHGDDLRVLSYYSPKLRYVREVISALDLNPENFVDMREEWDEAAWRGEKVFLPFAHPRDPRVVRYDSPTPWYTNPEHISLTRKTLLSALDVTKEQDELIIYISRNDVRDRRTGRQVRNEDEIIEHLRGRFGDKLYEFQGERHNLQATKDLFSRARAVIGPHGGAFCNLLFAPSSTKVVEFLPARNPTQFYYSLTSCLEMDYWPLPIEGAAHGNDLTVALDEFDMILSEAELIG
jgi:hypothetical protein